MNEHLIGSEKQRNAGKIPDQKELEKELSEYLSKKYGNRVKVVSPFVYPKAKESSTDTGMGGEKGEEPSSFQMLPEDLESYLDSYVVKQDNAKAILATKVCTHFNRVHYFKSQQKKTDVSGAGMIKNNILMIGPTGVGKTYIIKLIAHKLGVPFVKGDATKFSETGYVGGDVEDLVRDLVHEANDDIDLAENGIVYIDEIDKIASSSNVIGHDVSRTGVQRALLKPMEETDVDLKVPHDPVSQIQAIEQYRRTGKKEKKVVNTKNILFITSGAFGDLAEIIQRRLQRQGIGFEADVRPAEAPWDILREVTAQDLIEFGFESEFVGRLPVVVVFDELNKEDLVQILKNPNNPIIMSKKLDFRAYGIDIQFEEGAWEKIAEKAQAEKTGARGLVSVIEQALIPFEKSLSSKGVKRFLVTPEVIEHPQAILERLLKEGESPEMQDRFEKAKVDELENLKSYIDERADDFRKKSGLEIYERRMELIAQIYLNSICDMNTALDEFKEMYDRVRAQEAALLEKLEVKLTFEEEAIDEILSQAIESGDDAEALALQMVQKLEYGLKLVKSKSGIESFTIDKEAVMDMEEYINSLLRRYYHEEQDEVVDIQSQG